jgi:SAM-dependent methyltransferase
MPGFCRSGSGRADSSVTDDTKTASAFASSWNNLPSGSVYTTEQFEDWFLPLRRQDIEGKTVLELGCGNGSLMVHVAGWNPSFLEGVDLGDSVVSAKTNMDAMGFSRWSVAQADLTKYKGSGFDVVYCIGVLHHLENPKSGIDAVIANVKPGGRFHCWVYGREGNWLIIHVVDPIRRVVSRFPWWITKFLVATPLVLPYFFYAKLLAMFPRRLWLRRKMPLYEYSLWIAKRSFGFFRHVAFDQLVTPRTVYLDRATIADWVANYPKVDQNSVYILMRNGNSWKFGGRVL